LAARDVARHDHRLAAGAPDEGGHALRRAAVVQVVDADVGAVPSQRDRDGLADPLLRARDERNPAAEPHTVLLPGLAVAVNEEDAERAVDPAGRNDTEGELDRDQPERIGSYRAGGG